MGGVRLDNLARLTAQRRARRSVPGLLATAFLASSGAWNVAEANTMGSCAGQECR
jgi:hypothetical protein